MKTESSSLNVYAYSCLVLSAFACAFSLPLGRIFMVVAFVLLCADCVVCRKLPKLPVTVWLGFAFLLMLSISTVLAEEFVLFDSKLDKLFWFVGLPLAALLITSSWRLVGLLGGYSVGVGLLSVKTCYDSILLCVNAKALAVSEVVDYKLALRNGGSMTDGERYMLAVIVSVAMVLICRKRKCSSLFWWMLLVMQVMGLVLTLKRASLICAVLLVGLLVLLRANWKYLFLLGVVVISVAFLPPVRARLAEMKGELNAGKGGRMTMWTKIAPELIKRKPIMGMGYRMLKNEQMVAIAPEVERNRDHLHSNPIQVTVEGGVFGLVLYLLWMFSGAKDAVISVVRSRDGSSTVSIGLLASALMFAGLFLHGIVEYNLGDGEIVLLYGMVMGCCAAGSSIASGKNSGQLSDSV